ncbi:MAG TPA: hypothetical protein VIV12_17960 [Streptosporangiaceae bacterium]
MSLDAESPESPARHVRTAATASLARVRRGSLAVLVLVVVEYGIGMYVNLYVTIPRADHGHGLGSAIANGPAMLSIHAVIGLLLGLGALGVLVQAVIARHLGAIASSAAGLFALAFASATGASFTSSGQPSESMGMSVLTGVGLLCYAANLYLLRPPG